MDWLVTFWNVLTRPTSQTFLAEAKKADGKFTSAISLLVFYGLYVYILASIAINRELLSLTALLACVLIIPLAVLLFTFCAHYLSQRLRRRKNDLYDKMLYITVSIFLPLSFVMITLFLFISGDVFRLLTALIELYQIVLLTLAIKALVDIEYWQALVIVFLSVVASIVVCAIALLTIYSTIAPPNVSTQ